jgi:tetratricopeptide (TPR) repeat protein
VFRRKGAPGPADEPPELPEGEVLLLDPSRQFWRPRVRTALLLLVVVGGLGAGGVWLVLRKTPEQRARDLRDLARTELMAGHPDLAEPLLAESIRLDPRDADALHTMAMLQQHTGRPAEAEATLRAALTARPRHVPSGVALARILGARGELDAALALLDRAVEASKSEGAALAARAEVRLDRGDLGGALDDLVECLRRGRDPDAAPRCLLAGHIAEFLGRTTWSADLLRLAEDLYATAPTLTPPRDRLPVLVAAEAHLAAGRTRTALSLLEGQPREPLVAVLRSEALRLDGAPEDAETVLRDEVARQDTAVARAALVRLLAGQGRVRAAALELDEARRRHPDDANVAHAAALVARAAAAGSDPSDLLLALLRTPPGTYNPAEAVLADRALRSPVGHAATRAGLAFRGLSALGRPGAGPAVPEEAQKFEEWVEELLRASPDDPDARLWRGAVRLRRGDAEAGLDDLDVAVAKGAAGGRARLVRALALGARGRWADALEDVRAAVGASPTDPVSAAVETRVWLGLEDRETALAVARRASARWPGDLALAFQMKEALTPAAGAAEDPAAARERKWIETRLRLVSLDPKSVREAVRTLADEAVRDDAASAALAGFWDDVAAEWAARERDAPGDERAALSHAASLVRAGRPRRAEDVLRRAAERTGGESVVVARARILARMGAYDAAEAALRPLIEARPQEHGLQLEMAAVHLARGNDDAGATILRRVLAAPDAPPALRADAALALVSGERVAAADADRVLAWIASPAAAGLPADDRRLLEGTCRLVLGQTGAAVAAGDEVLRAQPGRVRAAVLTARGWLLDGQPERAEAILTRVLAQSPREPLATNLASHVRLLLGLRAFDAGDRAAAAGWWEAAFTGSQLDFVAASVLADLHLRVSDPHESSAAVGRLSSRNLGSAAVSLLRGRDEEVRGRAVVARADYREALSRDPAHPATVSAFVGASLAAGDLDAAEKACRRAIDAGDRFGLVHCLLAATLERKGDAAGAEAAWRRALALDPANFGALASLSGLLVRAGRADDARALVTAVRPGELPQPGVEERFARVRAYVETGPTAGAIDRLREILAGRPNDWAASLAFGRALVATGDVAGALSWFERSSDAAPGEFEPRVAVVEALARLGRLDEAEGRLRDRTREHPDDAGAWCLLGMIASERKQPEAAEQNYRRARAAAPGDPLAANTLACVVFDLPGRRREALDLIERAARERPEVPHLGATRGWLLLRDGNASAALAVLDETVARHPTFAQARLNRAEAYLAVGRREAAGTEFAEAVRLAPSIAGRASAALRELPEVRR